MIINDLKENLVTHLDDTLDIGEMGTSSQAPVATDTDLILGEASSQASISGVQAGRQLTITYNLNSVTGNGNTYKEFGNFLTGSTLINRVVFTDLPKTSAVELQVSTIIQVP